MTVTLFRRTSCHRRTIYPPNPVVVREVRCSTLRLGCCLPELVASYREIQVLHFQVPLLLVGT